MGQWSKAVYDAAWQQSFLEKLMNTTPSRLTGEQAVEFILWLNGAFDMLDATPPDQQQWDKIRNAVVEQVGAIVRAKIEKELKPNPVQAINPGATISASKSFGLYRLQQDMILEQQKLALLGQIGAGKAVSK